MKKQEFISELKRALAHAPSHIREEIMADISEHFSEAIAQGMTEEEVCRNLGDPQGIAAQVMEEYGETRSGGYDHPVEDFGNMFSGFKKMFGGEVREVDINESFTEISDIRVKLTDAKVRFSPSADNRFRVTVRGQTRTTEIELYVDKGILTLTDTNPGRNFNWFNWGFKSTLVATVYVPAQFAGNIKVRTAMGNISAADISGRLDFKAAAGNVTVDNCISERMRISTAAGNATLHLAGIRVGELDLSAAAGNVKITADETTRMKLSSAAGNINAQITRLYGKTDISSAAGSITLTAHDVAGDISISTAAGSAKVYLPRDVNCRIDAKKPAIGSISNELEGNPHSPHTLRVSTSVGSVKIRAL